MSDPVPLRSVDVDAYLTRIGVPRPDTPTAAALRALQWAHLLTVPFETIDLHTDVPIVLEETALFDKIVRRRRGGFCYELNGLFAALLRALGFRVDLLAVRVADDDGILGVPFDHLCLLVHLEEAWVADVGFGAHAALPLRADHTGPQPDREGTFEVRTASQGDPVSFRDLAVYDGERLVYVAERRPRELSEFEIGAWWQASNPASGFRRGPTCSRFTEDGRITLAGNRLIRTADGARHETMLDSEDDIRAAYRHHFGVEIDRLPRLSSPSR